MKLESNLVKKISKNSGSEYYCIEIKITPTYTKTVFLEKAEIELVQLLQK